MNVIHNPILPGFNPDPSFLRVGDDYYIAVSTFEWWPGVAIYHSKDLIHWQLRTHPLTRTSQLDLMGVPSSGGIWAPHLSYCDGIFYLLFTNVRSRKGVFKDTPNYLVTSASIDGPWSEPIFLNSSGFDPSMFHDSDNRKWLFNMQWDYRKGKNRFGGIVMQEYCAKEQKMIGPIYPILGTSQHGCTEGPHVFKKDDYYYLLFAEGGTGYNHGASLARSQQLTGPYEVDSTPVLTTRHVPDYPMQKAGHGSLVETQNGEWYMAHLCGRPMHNSKLCPLGRETAIQKVGWTEDGWLRLADGGVLPSLEVVAPQLDEYRFDAWSEKDEFDSDSLRIDYYTLRTPPEECWISLKARKGYLRLIGRESLHSWHEQSLVARRLEHFYADIETCLQFEPENFMQAAGLIAYFDEMDHYYLRVSRDEKLGKQLCVVKSDQGQYDELEDTTVSVEGWNDIYMKLKFSNDKLQFSYSHNGSDWTLIGPELDAGLLGDEYMNKLGFTGTMIGLCAQDLSGAGKHADFDYFQYRGQSI